MRVVLVGNGGREHALAWRIARSPTLTRLIVTAPNPGWPERADLIPATKPAEIVALAKDADLVVVGPEAPLAAGLADEVCAAGVPCFGPVRAAARLEASKAFAKEVMAAAGVPTAASLAVDRDDPRARERCARGDVVLKADGLAAGKGVVVCATPEEALAALDGMARFGDAARTLVLEDRLTGPEVSVFALCDGVRAVPLPSAQDHKTLLDGGRGPMTGGMGAYVPCPLVDADAVRRIVATVHQPVVDEMARRGAPYRGVLFAGLMLTPDGPKVLEFNVRFGDPECQPLMALWDEDVLPWLHGAATGTLPAGEPRFGAGSACCVVLAAPGYPDAPQKGIAIPEPAPSDGVLAFHAGTTRGDDGVLRTNGGRVLGLTGVGPDLATARARAYDALPGWWFPGEQHRSDIGAAG
jgi:phosphoribosylamine--glycine ligase